MDSPARRLTVSHAQLLVAATCLAVAIGDSINYAPTHPYIAALGVGTGLAAAAVLITRNRLDTANTSRWIAAAASLLFGVIRYRRVIGFIPVDTTQYKVAHHLAVALPGLGLVVLFAGTRVWTWRLFLIVFATAEAVVLRESHRPFIDVWFLLRHASTCVTHMCNPYAMSTPATPGVSAKASPICPARSSCPRRSDCCMATFATGCSRHSSSPRSPCVGCSTAARDLSPAVSH